MGILSFIILTIYENNKSVYQIFNSNDFEYFPQIFAGKDDDNKDDNDEDNDKDTENSADQKLYCKLFESESCTKDNDYNDDKQIEKEVKKEELTEEETQSEAIINKYLEPIESEKELTDNSLNAEKKIVSNVGATSNKTLLSNKVVSNNISNSNQQFYSKLLTTEVKPPVLNNPSDLTSKQNLNNLNQFQLVDLIASTISNSNNIDKNKVIQSLNDLIAPTKAKGGNVNESLRKISDIVTNDPSGNLANKLVNIARTK